MKNIFILIAVLFPITSAFAQTDNPFIKLVDPLKEHSIVGASHQFIIGSTCKTCTVTINNQPAKVWSTGAIAYEINLSGGDNNFVIVSSNTAGKTNTKTISFTYNAPKPATP